MRLITGRNLLRKTLHEDRQKHPFGLEEAAARTASNAKRLKFLMFEQGNLRLPSEFEKFQ